jgi:hypothetical protein
MITQLDPQTTGDYWEHYQRVVQLAQHQRSECR